MPHTSTPASCLQLATLALGFHPLVGEDQSPLPRSEVDAVHAHATALYELVDRAAARTRPTHEAEGDHLRAARTRLWQAAEHLHDAFHSAPRPDSSLPGPEQCRSRRPDGTPELTICQRHLVSSVRLRRQTTPAELRAPFTGLIRH